MAKKRVGQRAKKHAKTGTEKKPASDRSRVSSEDLPRVSLEDSLSIPRTLRDPYGDGPAKWPEIAKTMGVSHKNPRYKYALWAATAYGVVKKEADGSYSLAEKGRKILAPNYDGEDKEAILQSIQIPTLLGKFYADYDGKPLPSEEHMLNVLENRYKVPTDRRKEAALVIVKNAGFAGILRELPDGKKSITLAGVSPGVAPPEGQNATDEQRTQEQPVDYTKVCFLITPIGNDDSEERKHADLILKHLVAPVLDEHGFTVVRADKIGKPGVITQQVIQYLAKSRLCIADLSFSNPNAFYETGVRHTFKLATIQIIRKGDKIPFDVAQGRTIIIDTSDVYTIMDKMASAREELKEHVTSALTGAEGAASDNPISYYLPTLTVRT